MHGVNTTVVLSLLGVALMTQIAFQTRPSVMETLASSAVVAETSVAALSTSSEEFVEANDGAGAPVAFEGSGVCETPEEMLGIINSERMVLEKEKDRASRREAEIELALEKLDVEKRMLQELKDEVDGLIMAVEKTHTEDLGRLVKLYLSMKPTEAAAIMDDMDVAVTVMILGKMNEGKAGPILAKMSPVRSRAISKIIYERSKLPGDQDLNGIRLK